MSKALMANIEKIVLSYALSSSLPSAEQNSKSGVGFAAIPLLMFGAGLVLITYGVYLLLLRNATPDIAMLGTGFFALLIAALCVAGRYLYSLYRFKRIEKTKNDIIETLRDTLAIIEEEIATPVSEYPKVSLVASSVAGFIAGQKIL